MLYFDHHIDYLGYCNSKYSQDEYFLNFIKEINDIKAKYLFLSEEMYNFFRKIKSNNTNNNIVDDEKQIIKSEYDHLIVLSNSKDIEKTSSYVKTYHIYNYPNAGHLMVDLETMGKHTNSPIIAIGAVEFDIETGQTYREFYEKVTLQSSMDIGTKPCAETIMWWMKQSEEARKTIYNDDGVHIKFALKKFTDFINEIKPKNLQIWGNSNRFDLGILANSYELLNQKHPWKHSLERDVRTLVSFKPEIKEHIKNNFKGILHNPIDDCKNEIEYSSTIFNNIRI